MAGKADIKMIAAEQPWLSASEIANYLGRDPRNTRRDIKELKERGELAVRKDDRGVERYARSATEPASCRLPEFPKRTGNSVPAIDGTFTDVTPPCCGSRPAGSSPAGRAALVGPASLPSTGRELVPSTQPADSRLQAALQQHALAKARAGLASQGQGLLGQAVALLNQAFVNDPDGVEALAGLQQEWTNRLRAQTEHEAWMRQEYTRRLQEQQEREAQEKKRRQDEEVHAAIQQMYGLDKDDEPPPRGRVNFAREEESEPPVDRFRDRQRQEAETRPSPIAELLAKARTSPKTETQSQAEELSWWRRRFGTPKKATWR